MIVVCEDGLAGTGDVDRFLLLWEGFDLNQSCAKSHGILLRDSQPRGYSGGRIAAPSIHPLTCGPVDEFLAHAYSRFFHEAMIHS